MKDLQIVWQRLVNAAGTTCPRCEGTGDEVYRAVERLASALQPLGVRPTLEVRALDQAAFSEQPSESNRIWVGGRPLESWVDGQTGSSRCCDECGDNDCRTLEVGGRSYEVIPAELLIRAGFVAASALLDDASTTVVDSGVSNPGSPSRQEDQWAGHKGGGRKRAAIPGRMLWSDLGACATAVRLADAGKRVLLVSTDPASNVGQVFGITIRGATLRRLHHQDCCVRRIPGAAYCASARSRGP